MGFFRRREETLNQQLLREAGLDRTQETRPTPHEQPLPPLDVQAGRHPADDPIAALVGAPWRPAACDAFVTATAPGLSGDRVGFTALPEGDLLVDEKQGDADLSPLADAVEQELRPPYRVVAERQGGDLWACEATRVEVLKLDVGGADTLELTCHDGRRELHVDGRRSDVELPELVARGEREGRDYAIEAERLDGDLWEIRASAL